MKKISIVCLAVVMAVVFGFGNAFAASAKATCQFGDLEGVVSKSYVNIFEQTIHTASQKDIFVDVSLECGLMTNTKVMSKQLAKAIANAEAIVKIRVLVDPVFGLSEDDVVNIDVALSQPGEVVFARRQQTLIAEFAGDFSECMTILVDDNGTPDDTSDDTSSIDIDWECVKPETLELVLDTMTANSFNFMHPDLDAGTHTVVVQANLAYQTDAGTEIDETFAPNADFGSAAAAAVLGKGSVTVESVRMIKGEDVEL